MPSNAASTVLRFIRKLAANDPRLTDRDLLRRFVDHREEAAFEALMARHGPMVMSVCRRILTNWHDAEDACQAAFLVQKAGSRRWQDSVANWLYKTAYQTALRARSAAGRRSKHEGRVAGKTPANPLAEITGQELLAVLDLELLRVPERFRAPLVLCYLEGLTRDEAARQLDCPLRTLQRRLQRGRDLLHQAMLRRGLTLSAGLAAIMLTPGASQASMPALIIRQTVEAALLLATGKPAAADKTLTPPGCRLREAAVLLGPVSPSMQGRPSAGRLSHQPTKIKSGLLVFGLT